MKKRHHPASGRPRLAPVACAAALLCLPLLAQAQAQANPSTLSEVRVSGDASRSFSSRNVQVGAFRDQDPLDVPLTNNVVTREVLDAQGTNTLFGALRNTAGVTRSQLSGSTYDNISIRGLLVENRGNYRLNGFLPVVNLISIPLENKEQVEVLKGASSLYYGFVPPSGIVNFVTKRAGKTPVTSVATSVNDHGAVDVHADIGRRFGVDDSMGLRLNAVAGKEEYGVRNFDGDRQLLSAAYDWNVRPGFNLKLDLEHYRKDVSEQAAIGLPIVSGRAVVPSIPDNKSNLAGEWQRYDAEATNVLLRGDLALGGDWGLTLETGHAESKRDRRLGIFRFGVSPATPATAADLSTGSGRLDTSFVNGQVFENTSHRADLNGRFATGPVAHDITIGTMYNQRESHGGVSVGTSQAQNFFNPVPVLEPSPTAFTRSADTDIVDKGVYVFDRMTLSPQWQLMAGLRYSDYDSTTIPAAGPRTTFSATDTSPNLSVLYKPAENLSIYGSYLEGLEETGTAPDIRANRGDVLPPAVNKQYELGTKWRSATGALLQAALFDIRRPYTTIDASNRFVVGGKSRYRGLELSASGELSRQLSVIASALLLDANVTSSTIASELGKTPENTPRRTFSVFGEYRVAQVPGWSLNAGAFYVGKRPVNNANDAFVGAYTVYSVGTRYRTKLAGYDTTLQANIDNLTDRDYWATAGNGLLGTGAPRTLRVGAKIDL
jgi:iron complex outermembrane receptor protein